MIKTSFDPSRPYRYARYGRMSDPRQNARSPEQQFDEIDRTLRRCGYHWVHVGDYRDDGVSGRTVRKRAGFKRLLDDIATERIQIDALLVDTLERFGRMDSVDALRQRLLNRHGVLVLTADSNLADPTSVAGKALTMFESIRATADAHVKGHNVLRGKRDAVKRKHWPGSKPPIGYRLDSIMKSGPGPAAVDYRRLVPEPDGAAVVRQIFRLADDNGWGTIRIAKRLNADESIVRKHGTFGASRVGKILENLIYKGTMRFGFICTDIIEDRRVVRRNPDDEVLYVSDFCEPLVPAEVFDRVSERRRKRGDTLRALRKAGRKDNGKLLQPMSAGLVLNYPLVGLCRCAECGSAMRPNKPGKGSRRQYYYLRCPLNHDGRCCNDIYLRGDRLWTVVVTRIRERLFPLPADGESTPDWLATLVSQVRAELRRRSEQEHDRRPLLERERQDLEKSIDGWTQSLGTPELSGQVRSLLVSQIEAAAARREQIGVALRGLDEKTNRATDLLQVDDLIDRLHRLDEVLASGNATDINVALSEHIVEIRVFRNRKVIMYTDSLGVFKGVRDLLAASAGADDDADGAKDERRPRAWPRPLPVRRTTALTGENPVSLGSDSPLTGPVALPDKWTNQDEFVMPSSLSWTAMHAAKVAQKYAETHWSKRELAAHFGVSIPSIRKALRIAKTAADRGD